MARSVIVIGRGIIGASVAYYLQRAGANVTLVGDQSDRATDGSFGWINASFHNDDTHYHIRNEGLTAYARLSETLDLPIAWRGCLCWETEGEALQHQLRELQRLGYQASAIGRGEFTVLEPNLPNPPEACLYMPQEAAAESGELADALSQAAIELGATEVFGHVTKLIETSGRIEGVEIDGDVLRGDQVVVAAGIHAPSLVEPLGVPLPMLERPAVILKTKPIAKLFSRVLVSEIGEVRQLPDGSILMPAAVGHQSYDKPAEDQDLATTTGDALVRLSSFIGVELEVDWAKHAFRPVPKDGLPVIGRIAEGGYVAVMHSGITLGAIAGELVSEEVLQGPTASTAKWLNPYRPERFA